VNRLDDRHAGIRARVVCGRRDKRKGVVKVSHVRSALLQQAAYVPVAILRPGGAPEQTRSLPGAIIRDLAIVADIFHHLMPGSDEQIPFPAKDLIFAARDLIVVVSQQNSQKRTFTRQNSEFESAGVERQTVCAAQ